MRGYPGYIWIWLKWGLKERGKEYKVPWQGWMEGKSWVSHWKLVSKWNIVIEVSIFHPASKNSSVRRQEGMKKKKYENMKNAKPRPPLTCNKDIIFSDICTYMSQYIYISLYILTSCSPCRLERNIFQGKLVVLVVVVIVYNNNKNEKKELNWTDRKGRAWGVFAFITFASYTDTIVKKYK